MNDNTNRRERQQREDSEDTGSSRQHTTNNRLDPSSSLYYDRAKQERAKRQYQELLSYAREEEKILGVILSGSRGKGQAHKYSDYDLSVIVEDEDVAYYRKIICSSRFEDLGDAGVSSIQQVRKGYDYPHWARYGLARLEPPVDKTGEIAELLDQYDTIPQDKVDEVIKGNTSAYINGIFRSLKSFRAGDTFSSHFMAQESIRHLIPLVFAIHDGREAPYPKYLRWEVLEFPLFKLEQLDDHPLAGLDLFDMIETIMREGDIATQQQIFESIYELLYQEGYGSELEDEWGESHINLIRYFDPASFS